MPGRHSPFIHDLADCVRPSQRIIERLKRHGADLSRTMTLLAVFLQSPADVFGVSDAPLRLGLCRATDTATRRLRPRHGNLLAGQDLIEGDSKVAARRFSRPRVSDTELIVDASLITDRAGTVHNEHFRRAAGAELIGDFASGILDDWKGNQMTASVFGDALPSILCVGIDADKSHAFALIFLVQLRQDGNKL